MDQADLDYLASTLAAELDLPTLRDRFAMAALQGELAAETEGWCTSDKRDGSLPNGDPRKVVTESREQQLATRAYRMADAMMKAREVEK
jgi:hypothetical protein